MSNIDLDFQSVVQQIMRHGDTTETRNGTVKRSFYPFTFRCDSAPLVGWRKINHHLGLREMESFVNAADEIEDLDPSIRKWWEPTSKNGHLGHDWYSDFYGADLPLVINSLRDDPFGRRHLFSAWELYSMMSRAEGGFLPNCHSTVSQFYVSNDKKLHYKTYQRSADVMLGLPYNLIQHWALLEYVAYMTELEVGTMSYMLGDAHIYESHWKAADKLAKALRIPDNTGKLVYVPSDDKFQASDFTVVGDFEFPIKDKLKMEV